MKRIAIILAGGLGTRLDSVVPKQFVALKDKPLLDYSLKVFNDSKLIDVIVLVMNEKYIGLANKIIKDGKYKKVKYVVKGGSTRFESVKNGVNALKKAATFEDIVLVHDSARPLVSDYLIRNVIDEMDNYSVVVPTIKCKDSVLTGKDGVIDFVENRDYFLFQQTPIAAKYHVIKDAYSVKIKEDIHDDVSIFLKKGNQVHYINGDPMNIKLTTPDDLVLINALLNKQ